MRTRRNTSCLAKQQRSPERPTQRSKSRNAKSASKSWRSQQDLEHIDRPSQLRAQTTDRHTDDRVFRTTHPTIGTLPFVHQSWSNHSRTPACSAFTVRCGRTHTITGTMQQPGIIFLTVQELFEWLGDLSSDKVIEISLSYLEIYNETIRYFLIGGVTPNGGLMSRENSNQAVSVSGLDLLAVPQTTCDSYRWDWRQGRKELG